MVKRLNLYQQQEDTNSVKGRILTIIGMYQLLRNRMILLRYFVSRRCQDSEQMLWDKAKPRQQAQDEKNETKSVKGSLSHLPGYDSEGGKRQKM